MTTPPGSTGPNGNADRVWLRTDLPMEARVEALLAEMTLAEKVGQTHQSANIDPSADAELIRGGGIGSSLTASGALERQPSRSRLHSSPTTIAP